MTSHPRRGADIFELTGLDQPMTRRALFARAGAMAVVAAVGLQACSSDEKSSPTTGASTTGGGAATTVGGSGSTAPGSLPAATTTSKDTLVVALASTPPGIDWDAYFADESALSYNNLYNTMLAWKKVPVATDPDMLTSDFVTLEPQLAESYEFSNNGQTITLKLKQGVLSHAGNELTADDFIYTRERSLSLAAVGSFLLNAQGIKRPENVVKIDKYTVQVSSDEGPNPLLAAGNTNIFFNVFDSVEMKKRATASDPWSQEWVKTNSAGFGPYKLTSLNAGQGMTWEAHEQYWGGAPAIKKVIFQEVPESSNRLSLLTSGSVDIADKLTPREMNSLAGNSAAKVWSSPSSAMGLVWINTSRPALNDVRVRQALSYAFPAEDVLKAVYFGFGAEITAPVPSIVPGYADISPYKYDLDKAKALLAEAGVTNLELGIIYPIGQDEIEQVALIYQKALGEIGVKLNLSKQPDAAFDDLYSVKGDYDLAMRKDGGPIQPDINYALGLYYLSKTDTRNCCNFTAWGDPNVDALIAEGRSIVDQDERIKFHTPIMQKVVDAAPNVWWSNAGYQVATSSKLQGITFESPQSILFKNITVA